MAQVIQVDWLTDADAHFALGTKIDQRRSRTHNFLLSPVNEGNNINPRVQSKTRRTGLNAHRPFIRVSGQGAFGVDCHALAITKRLRSRGQDCPRFLRLSIDRKQLHPTHGPTQKRNLE